MDIDTIWESIVRIKIRKDDTYIFTLKEIKSFAEIYNMSLDNFCNNILKLSTQQIYTLKKRKKYKMYGI